MAFEVDFNGKLITKNTLLKHFCNFIKIDVEKWTLALSNYSQIFIKTNVDVGQLLPKESSFLHVLLLFAATLYNPIRLYDQTRKFTDLILCFLNANN